jgi:tetratricopeptide (TPR) repeat protein
VGTKQLRTEIKELFQQIDQMYWSPQERQLINRAVDLAREIGDEELEYQARMRLTASAAQLGDTDSMLTSFAWCLAKYDSDPRKFAADLENGAADILWHFKWMIGALDRNSIFALAQNEAMLDDMEAHYRKAGLGMSGVITARFTHSWRTGQLERAKELRVLLNSTPRDSHSHCDACGRSQLAEFALEMGEEQDALRLVDEIVEGGYSCGEEPEGALAATLVAKLRAGRLEDARADHSRSYRLARTNPDRIGIVADNIAFCAITGNEARGLAMVERHINWLAHDLLDEGGHLRLLLSIGSVLEAVKNAGHPDQLVRGASNTALEPFFGSRQEPWTVAELAPAVWEAAAKIAAGFDARNGNDYVSGKIGLAKQLLDEHYDVPIHSDSFLAAPPPEVGAPTDFNGWYRMSVTCAVSGRIEESLEAGRRALDKAVTPQERADAYTVIIGGLVATDAEDEAEAVLAQRIALLRSEGKKTAAATEKKLGLILYGKLDDDSIPALEAAIARWRGAADATLADVQLSLAAALEETEANGERIAELIRQSIANSEGNPRLRQSALFRYISAQESSWEEAVESCEKILAQDPPEGVRAAALRAQARLFGAAGEFEKGAAAADEAARVNAALRFHGSTATAADLAGQLLMNAGRADEALTRFQYALREAEQEADAGPLIGLKFSLGRAMLLSGHPMEAVELFGEVNSLEADLEASDGDRAETLSWLGRAYYDFERYGNAVSCYSDAAELFTNAERPVDAASELLRKGRLLAQFEEYDDASEALAKALELVGENEEANGLLVRLFEACGDVKCKQGNADGLADFDRAIEISLKDEQSWYAADMLDSKARGLLALERYEDAVAAFLNAADAYSGADDEMAATRAEFFAGQIACAELEQNEAGAALMSNALERSERLESPEALNLRNAIALKLGDVLEGLGRITEANAARAQVQE